MPPQPSGIEPQTAAAGHDAMGKQTQLPPVQTLPAGQAPPSGPHESVPPQPSGAVPHAAAPHAAAAVASVQPHTFGVGLEPPPQLWPVPLQAPQLMVGFGHPAGLLTVPQLSPVGQLVAHVTHWPAALHVSLAGHAPPSEPQLTVLPQLSFAVPQTWPPQATAEDSGTQTHLLAVQVRPEAQAPFIVPHVTVPPVPQPSGTVPQLSPAGHAASGVHAHLLPEHVVLGAVVQVPQVSVPPHPFGTVPQTSPAGHAASGLQPH